MSYLDNNSSIQEIIKRISDQISKSQARQKEIDGAIQATHILHQSISKWLKSLTKLQREHIENQKLLIENLNRLIALEKKLSRKNNNNLPSTIQVYQSYESNETSSQKSRSILSIFKRKSTQETTDYSDEYNVSPAPEPVPPTPIPCENHNYSSDFSLVPTPQPTPGYAYSNNQTPSSADQELPDHTAEKTPQTITDFFLEQLVSTPEMSIDNTFVNAFRNFILQYDFVTSGFSDYKNVDPTLVNIADTIANNYNHIHFFMKRLKTSANTNDELVFEIQKRAIKAPSLVMDITKKLSSLGYFEKYEYQESRGILRIVPSNKVAYIQFITGKWLEIYANTVANWAIKKMREEQRILGLVLSNVKISRQNSKCIAHEFDTVIITPYRMYLIECKTGEYLSCLPKYKKIADEFNIPLNSIFIVVLDMVPNECQKMSETYHMRFCNQTTLYTTLMTEIKLDMDNLSNQNPST